MPVQTLETIKQEMFEENQRLWRKVRNIVIVAIALTALGSAIGIYTLRHESSVRTDQFCSLIVHRYNDVVVRYNETVAYLNSPAGKENSGLNKVIRERSLPQLRTQVKSEKIGIPQVCLSKHKLKLPTTATVRP